MDKVGIVTWYWGNYGSILQAYALQRAIESLGYKCEIIQHHINGDIKTQLKYRLSHEGFVSTCKYFLNKIVAKSGAKRQRELLLKRNQRFKDFISKNLKLSQTNYSNSDYKNCLDYDIYVCGSDQIWNPSFTFLSPFYWLAFLPDGRRLLSYAPSMGNAKLTGTDVVIVSKYLRKIDFISVREEKSAEMLRKIIPDLDIFTVCDPTLLIQADEWKKIIPPKHISERYLFAYLIRGNREQRELITNVAKKYGLRLVVYPFLEGNKFEKDELDWGDVRCFDDNPFDFLSKIMYADMVITDSFHCSIFSILFHKEFYVLRKTDDTTNQFNRLEYVLDLCGHSQRIIDQIYGFVRSDCCFSESDRAIDSIRKKSWNYLQKALYR